MKPIALSIAGSDPSGGAGVQADLKTFHQFGVYGEAVLTLLTVQNTRGVRRVELVEASLVAEQLFAVLEDLPPHAAKTGALGGEEIVSAIAAAAAAFSFPLVVDPVMISKHGAPLLSAGAMAALRRELLPRAFLVTPNLAEASELGGIAVYSLETMREAARRIHGAGARNVLVKGGHLAGDAADLLYDGAEWLEYSASRVRTRHTHGTGCTYSAAITAGLASGLSLPDSVARAKKYITAAIESNPGFGLTGPVNHHAAC